MPKRFENRFHLDLSTGGGDLSLDVEEAQGEITEGITTFRELLEACPGIAGTPIRLGDTLTVDIRETEIDE